MVRRTDELGAAREADSVIDSVSAYSVVCNSTAAPGSSNAGDGDGATALAVFDSNKGPAITSRLVGQGTAMYVAFLPGLSYFALAIPSRPIDETSDGASFTHCAGPLGAFKRP